MISLARKFWSLPRYETYIHQHGLNGKSPEQLTRDTFERTWLFLRYLHGEIELDPVTEAAIEALLA